MDKNKKSNILDGLRVNLNSIDRQIVELLDQRAGIVKEVGDYKKVNNIPIYQPELEKETRDLVLKDSKKVFPADSLMQIYTEIISAARAIEAPLKIGYLGPEGTYSELAVRKQFGSAVINSPLSTIADVFKEVENGKIDYGIVPIENSLEGTVNITLDEFVDSPLKVNGELYVNIHHNILANVEKISEIKRIYSHPQSFAQCRIWLESIAGSIAAEKYGLKVLIENIEDNPENTTRFWIISNNNKKNLKGDKTTILVSVKDKPGALLKLLSPFQVYNINLSKIESRPSKRRPWDYLFFMDIEGGVDVSSVKMALDKIKEDAVFVKVLGCYPKGNY